MPYVLPSYKINVYVSINLKQAVQCVVFMHMTNSCEFFKMGFYLCSFYLCVIAFYALQRMATIKIATDSILLYYIPRLEGKLPECQLRSQDLLFVKKHSALCVDVFVVIRESWLTLNLQA